MGLAEAPAPPTPVWNPNQLAWSSTLGDWWDFSDLTSLYEEINSETTQTTSGQPVGTALGQRGNWGLNATSLSSRPVSSTLGGVTGLTFDGTDFMRTNVAPNYPLSGASISLVMAFDVLSIDSTTDAIVGLGDANADENSWELQSNNAVQFNGRLFIRGVSNLDLSNGPFRRGVFTVIFDHLSGDITVRHNGTAVASSTGWDGRLTGEEDSNPRAYKFFCNRAETNPLNGFGSRLLIYPGALSGSDLTDAEAWATAAVPA